MGLNLGLILYDGKLVNHRSLLKIVCNPFLRLFGFQIASNCDSVNMKVKNLVINKCERTDRLKWSFKYEVTDKHHIIKSRLLY